MARGLSRRRFLQGAAVTAGAVVLRVPTARATPPLLDQTFGDDATGWGPCWHLDGVGNLVVREGTGLLQGGTRISPAASRVTAFAADLRVADAAIVAVVERTGTLSGVVLRRVGPGHQYQAVLGSAGNAMKLVRRTPDAGEVDLATTSITPLVKPCTLTFTTTGAGPTQLTATVVDALGRTLTLSATDDTASLAGPGDPGVLGTPEHLSRGIWLGKGELGGNELTAARLANEELSTGAFTRITVSSSETPRPSTPTFVAAGTGVPVAGGAHLRVVTDVPASVTADIGTTPDFADAVTVSLGATNGRHVVNVPMAGLTPGTTIHWRPRANGVTGPARRFRVLPERGDPTPVTIAIGSCAEQLGPTFTAIAAEAPDVFVWEGDLLYPDFVGPLTQTASGYAAWWKAILAAPELAPILDTACFATQRDDHDYGANNLATIPDHGVEPYESVLHPQKYYEFAAGRADVWVLDQRWWRSPAGDPDTIHKTLLGADQREWLFDGLATSTARFKLVCSPDPLYVPTNRDTNWGKGYTAERDLLVAHIAANVSGHTVFVTGDSHSAAVIETAGVLEVRASPMHTTNHPLSTGEDVVFADTGNFFCLVRVDATGFHIALVRDDGTRPWSTSLT